MICAVLLRGKRSSNIECFPKGTPLWHVYTPREPLQWRPEWARLLTPEVHKFVLGGKDLPLNSILTSLQGRIDYDFPQSRGLLGLHTYAPGVSEICLAAAPETPLSWCGQAGAAQQQHSKVSEAEQQTFAPAQSLDYY